MNLINDRWIPARTKTGEKIKIAPWQITEGMGTDHEIIELAAVRPDFNGALIQFLIGLLQTTCAPKDNSDWRSWLNTPPSAAELKKKFAPITFAFELDGVGPRFMQDLNIEKEEKKTEEGIANLLIDEPGEQTLKQNKDLFIKRDRIKQLCLSCGAQALLTLQINAPEGGRGHWAGLRGGGPVSTIVLDNNLWRTVWCNVLDVDELAIFGTTEKNDNADKFPWLKETRVSAAQTLKDEKGKKEKTYSNTFTSQDVNPCHIYWAISRRIRLCIDSEQCICDLCHQPGQRTSKYYTKPYGAKYTGFIHP
ncbi:MAG: type I-E CRISPR-associated protein Cse1/CasA, partial [Candidatus Omnitrophica bacterium]|nr:type I-E CRISPR-associated protein Cse1/CasA [Candidatus Omnitrophota bacterium]